MTSLPTTLRAPRAAAAPSYDPRWQNDGMVDTADVWRILWQRKSFILAIAAALTLLVLVYSLLTPSLYSATAQILIDPRDRQVVSNDVNPSSVSPDGGVTQVESQASVIQSAGVLLRAIAATDLTKDSEFNGIGLLGRLLGSSSPAPAASPGGEVSAASARTLANLRRKVAVKRADKVLVVDVSVTAQDPDKAARIANAIADAYLADQAEARAQSSREASEALTARLSEQRKRVEAAENAVERYRAANNLVAASGKLISDQQLTEISTQLSSAQSKTAALKAQIEQIDRQRRGGARGAASTEALQSAVIAKLREQEGTLVQREADLQSQYGPRHPAIAAARSQLLDVRQLITAELNRIDQAVRSDYDRALANEKLLASRVEVLTRQTQSSDQASVRLRELQRDLEAVRAVYANYLLRSQETREQANVDSTNARIISRALPPQRASWPPTPLLLAGAIFGGLGLGAGAALIREYASPRLSSSRQVQSLLGAPIIGVLPADVPPDAQRKANASTTAEVDMRAETVAGLALLRLFDMNDEQNALGVRSVLVTSTERDADERLRTVFLLAHVAALRGQRVLLVDADVDSNRESSVAGFLDVLRGEASLADTAHFESHPDVALMAKGRLRQTSPKASARASAIRMLADAGKRFDLVVVDGGVLTHNIKAAPLAGVVEELVLVARLNGTEQQAATQIAEAASIMGRSLTAVMLVDGTGRA